jgi:uncharacterized membrane protein YeaQ/YmgE (transglycosylase-associated protein family)
VRKGNAAFESRRIEQASIFFYLKSFGIMSTEITMDISIVQIIVWLIVGTLAGNLTGVLVKGRRKGFGRAGNIAIGLVGALIGGSIFNLLGIDLGLGELAISFQDLVAALLGSLVFLLAVWLARRRLS